MSLLKTPFRSAAQPQSLPVGAAGAAAPPGVAGAFSSPAALQSAAGQGIDLRLAVERASDAVGRGNHKVFEEIGAVFARFCAGLLDDALPDPGRLELFLQTLRPGEPPGGQRYLKQAFTRYYQALFEPDPKERAELLLCANLEIGFHEQTRLQPEIAEALDAPLVNASRFARFLFSSSSPFSGLWQTLLWSTRRLLYRRGLLHQPSLFDRQLEALLASLQRALRQACTQTIMAIRFPPDQLVRLGDDLPVNYPPSLQQLCNPDLLALLALIDPTPGSRRASGADDWADLPNRLHFIAELFRCFQESPNLFEPPFTPAQVAALRSGKLPAGRL